MTVRVGWTVSLGPTAGMSPVVWGPPMPLVGLLFALVALLATWAIVRGLRFAFGQREREVPVA